MNLKNKPAKKDLRLTYAQGNNSAYLENAKEMVELLLSQNSYKKQSLWQKGG